jgi:hypothetical protein
MSWVFAAKGQAKSGARNLHESDETHLASERDVEKRREMFADIRSFADTRSFQVLDDAGAVPASVDGDGDRYYGGSMYYGDGTVMGSIAVRTWFVCTARLCIRLLLAVSM